MKISYLLGALESTGGSIVLYNFMDNLVKRGHEVYAVLPNNRIKWEVGIWNDYLERESSNQKYFSKILNKAITFITNKNKKIKSLYDLFILKRFTDGLIQNWVESDITISTYSSTAYASFILSDKTVPLYHMQSYEELFFQDLTLSLIARNTYYLPLIMISNSSWLQNIIKNKIDKNSYLLNPGINLNVFKPTNKIEDKYKNKKEWTIVSYFSSAPLKGFKEASKSVEIARKYCNKKGINIKWKVFGINNPSEEYGTEFEFCGPKFGADLARLYSEADIVLSASWYESFPLPPLEAMACGSLAITTQYGTEDYVFDKENGLVCLPKKIEEMSIKIIYAIENPSECLKMVKNGLKTAENYSWDKRTDILEEILDNSVKDYSAERFEIFDQLKHGYFNEELYKEFEI